MTSQNSGTVAVGDAAKAALTRRQFVGSSLAAAGLSMVAARKGLGVETASADTRPADSGRRVRLGIVGCGGRGSWIARLFKNHGGYDLFAVADYFQPVADACGQSLGVEPARCFSGLSGYKRLLDAGVEAVALETPPCFFPEHARAAVEAGVHVFMAKPVAVDVPGCLEIEAVAKKATARKLCFLIDYQIPTEPHNIEIVRRIQAGQLGRLGILHSYYLSCAFPDPPLTDTCESRLQHLTWCNDVAIGGGYHVNACIHAVDAALWAAGKTPVSATGASRVARADPHGDSHDVFGVVYEFADGLIVSHRAKHLTNPVPGFRCGCEIHGDVGMAEIGYDGKVLLRSGSASYDGEVKTLYEAGAVRNIATFHKSIAEGDTRNPTVRHAVDGALTTILGREAALRKSQVTWDQLLKENKRLDLDLHGLKS
jgi:myo-inositol 2-dehydrogenase / D-chiro-inositol 1-dehydrogenase